MKTKNLFYLCLLSFWCIHLSAQELPPINTFLSESYKAESQNWAISQSDKGETYLANNKGLLEFNGAEWKLYPTPNETIMRSVKVIKDKIFTGFHMNFGYWVKDNSGSLHYTSLTEKLQIPLLEDEQFWNIITLDDWVLFQSLQRIYLLNLKSNKVKTINAETSITKIFKIDDTIYFHQINKGIFKIEQGKASLVWDYDVLKSNNVVDIVKTENSFLFVTAIDGVFELKDKALIQWKQKLNTFLKGKTIYNAIQLSNKDLVLGTISHGAIYVNKTGEIEFELNKKNGLNNNTVLSIYEDIDKNVWLGLDNGVGVVNINSPFKIFKDLKGNVGTVYTSIIHQNNLYLGTNQGLFFKKYNSGSDFSFIEGSQGQVWSLKVIDDELFCGHNSGTYVVKNNKIIKIANEQGAWDFQKVDKNTLLQGNYNGLHILKKYHKTWEYSHKIEGFDISSRYFVFKKPNKIFVNHEYKGLFKLQITEDLKQITSVTRDSLMGKGLHSSLISYNKNVLYTSKKGIYKYDNDQNTFIKDTLLSKLITKKNYTSGKLIFDNQTNKLWSFSKNNIHSLSPGNLSSQFKLRSIHVSNNLIKKPLGYENINKLEDNKYLIGGLDGYVIADLDRLNGDSNYTVKLHSIVKSSLNGEKSLLNFHENSTLKYEHNNINFFYSIPYFGKDLTVYYQYKLIGHNEHWSPWSTNPSVLFKNLSFGNYTLKVRGKVGNTISTNEISYTFTVLRPWYLSNIMLIGYFLIILLFSIFMHNFYKKHYEDQREKLLEKQKKDFEFKSLANEKELMKIKNEQLKADVESKNRELAISTMSIIKKNEFLSSIKNELKPGDEKSTKKVIRIINQNLNNTDDWQMFKEAFNNADKDFIKKIKNLHPSLTPNDLRLCAYLRLNLSSKEIAPLLNISPKSVEVKRYRLRKKMNLPHDINLTTYILEIK
ncbi:triple tyrosine motif-containing protein [Tenacibaculum sp. IB213877]|uniref:helix-turn-helix and ligand-binding sensor domain-containing protein n=1 Tax=Tenacibaculum sp. IB213877 TaxID=3097351 RepID=UPI002A5AAECC|nr:triple tyrosine motif-containing protein [Tenacibaculum sp. IB213877]MDY0779520.1 triple tyrosine motif-containing protein [Tenacibaculum sp. IB213877]